MTFHLGFFAASLVLTLLFFLYGFNHYYLLYAARKYKAPALPERPAVWPAVSIQLPIYNERFVVHRLVAACAAMAEAYGKDKASLLILDDSDDDTVGEVDAVVEEYRQKQFSIRVLRRGNRKGFKAGALQAALNGTEAEFIAIFDADFIPETDFLLRTVPHFENNSRVGIIQSRWSHWNRDLNLLTQAVSHAIDVHFLIEQPGRYSAGIFQNFNGSGGVLRKKAIVDAGGWQADTLAEDLDLSYRMQMLGYRILYLRDVLSPGEIPPTVPSFKQQQGRWACGSIRAARKILPGLIRNRNLGFKQRLEAVLHLTGYMIHPLMVVAFVLSCFAAILGINNINSPQVTPLIPAYRTLYETGAIHAIFLQNMIWFFLTPLIALCTLGPWISLWATLRIQNLFLVRNLASLIVLLMLCFGISLSIMRGVGQALFTNRVWEWTRTPKYDNAQTASNLQRNRYRIPLDSLWVWELAFTLLGVWAIVTAIRHVNVNVIFILVPYTVSYGFVFLFSILQSRRARS